MTPAVGLVMSTALQHNPMPVLTTASGILSIAALMPGFAAVTIIVNPLRVEGFTALGALVAVFFALAFLRIQAPHLGSFYNIALTFIITLFTGWLLPEPLLWWAVKCGWMHQETLESMPLKIWALLSLICGLAGSTLVIYAISWIKHRLPAKLDEVTSVARVPLSDTTDLEMRTLPKSAPASAATTVIRLPEAESDQQRDLSSPP